MINLNSDNNGEVLLSFDKVPEKLNAESPVRCDATTRQSDRKSYNFITKNNLANVKSQAIRSSAHYNNNNYSIQQISK